MPLPRPSQTLKIGLLGGSFNPAHAGHLEISLAAIEHLKLNAVWWLVTPGNPLKDETLYAPYEERLFKARALVHNASIVVSDFEERRGIQYTVETLSQLKEINPEAHFVWLMGADSFADFHRWKDWRRIAGMAPMAIFNRPEYEQAALSGAAATALAGARVAPEAASELAGRPPPAWVYIEDTNNPSSSTEIRKTDNARRDRQ